MTHWMLSTEIPATKQALLVAFQLRGLARECARELTPGQLQNGDNVDLDGQGTWTQLPAPHFLIWTLPHRFKALGNEASIRSMLEYQQFRRLSGESMDEVLARYELVRGRARRQANFNMGITGDAHLLLHALHIPVAHWHSLLMPFGGNLPSTDVELQSLITHIRRSGHLSETRGIQAATTRGMHFTDHMPVHDSGFGFSSFPVSAVPTFPSSMSVDPFAIPEAHPSYSHSQGAVPSVNSYPSSATYPSSNSGSQSSSSHLSCLCCSTSYAWPTLLDDNDNDEYGSDTDDEAHLQDFDDYPRDANGQIDHGEVWHQMWLAKRRWRSLVRRPARRLRFRLRRGSHKGFPSKGYGKGGKRGRLKRKSGWSFISDFGDGALCLQCQHQSSVVDSIFWEHLNTTPRRVKVRTLGRKMSK